MKRLIQFIKAVRTVYQIGSENILENIDELVEQAKQANRDDLTGLYSYRFFQKVLTNAIEWVQRYQWPLSIAFLDLDGFKQINDLYGHQKGNEVLQGVAQALKSYCRKTDILVRPDVPVRADIPVRWGGDEFVLLLIGTTQNGAEKLIQRIIRELEVKGIQLSYGIASWDEGFVSIEEFIAKADERLYQNKEEKKGFGSCA